jgi:hypothetical protein
MILDTILSLVNGIMSTSATDDYSKDLGVIKEQQRVSEATRRGEAMYRELAGGGLPGYESDKAEIDTQIPTTLNAMKDYVSGGGLIDAVSSLSANVARQKRDLATANERALIANKQAYANYLGGVSGPAEAQVLANKSQLGISQAYENLLGKQSAMTWANTGVGGMEKDAMGLLSTPGVSGWLASALSGEQPKTYAEMSNSNVSSNTTPFESPTYDTNWLESFLGLNNH